MDEVCYDTGNVSVVKKRIKVQFWKTWSIFRVRNNSWSEIRKQKHCEEKIKGDIIKDRPDRQNLSCNNSAHISMGKKALFYETESI